MGGTEADVLVEFFHSISKQEHRAFPRREVIRVPLTRQTRCYLYAEDEGRWYVGRIGERDGYEYEVNLPDQASIWVHEASIYVRSAMPIDDPTDTLIARGYETAWYWEARHRLVQTLMQQRAAAGGMTGLISARIELFPHQVEVARRVLSDPIQRYLLADEVGLGKTIEAGIVIRQFLLDESTGHVLLVVPPLLVEQWRSELDTRFEAFLGDRVHLVGTMDLGRVPSRVPWSLLVIDEAHHVAAGATSSDPLRHGPWVACERLAATIGRVILLSATPASTHEAQFLAMLHLLDPSVYSINEVQAFQDRVARRQDIGRVLLTITETAKPYALRIALRRLAELFPNDGRLRNLKEELLQVLDGTSTDGDERVARVRAIRTHVSETYRLHRRMLRNRRSALASAVLPRDHHRLVEHCVDAPAWAAVHEALDEWRALIAFATTRLDAGEQGAVQGKYSELFRVMTAAAWSTPVCLANVVRARLGLPHVPYPQGNTHPQARGHRGGRARSQSKKGSDPAPDVHATPRVSAGLPLLQEEGILLHRLLEAAEVPAATDSKVQLLLNLLLGFREQAGSTAPPKCVIFSEFEETCHLLAATLSVRLGRQAIAGCYGNMPPKVIEEDIHRFGSSRDCFVLLSDVAGEEGRNLQRAEHLILFDLPWSPNQLEQRIGRVDRISRVRNLTFHVIAGPQGETSLATAWYRVLRDGFQIFTRSIAGLQFYTETKIPTLWDAAFVGGAAELTVLAEVMPGELEREQERLEEQAAVDEMDVHDEEAARVSTALDKIDMAEARLEADVETWLCQVLGFERETERLTPGVVRYRASKRTMVPEDIILNRFKSFLGRRGTFRRTLAAQDPNIALLRLGEGLIDALAEYVRWDDRGQAFAFWRELASWDPTPGAEWIGFRFDLVVEADTQWAEQLLGRAEHRGWSRQALSRRGDAALSPVYERIFLDAEFREVQDPSLLEVLTRPFDKRGGAGGRDYNLTKHRSGVLDEIIAPDRWEGLCRGARAAAEEQLRARPAFQARCHAAASAASRRQAVIQEQLALRAQAGGVAGRSGKLEAVRDLDLEQAVGETIIRGIKYPRIRVDSAGLIVLAGRSPDWPEGTALSTAETTTSGA